MGRPPDRVGTNVWAWADSHRVIVVAVVVVVVVTVVVVVEVVVGDTGGCRWNRSGTDSCLWDRSVVVLVVIGGTVVVVVVVVRSPALLVHGLAGLLRVSALSSAGFS